MNMPKYDENADLLIMQSIDQLEQNFIVSRHKIEVYFA